MNHVVHLLGRIYLPPYDCTSIEFLKQVLNGNKNFLLNRDVENMKVP